MKIKFEDIKKGMLLHVEERTCRTFIYVTTDKQIDKEKRPFFGHINYIINNGLHKIKFRRNKYECGNIYKHTYYGALKILTDQKVISKMKKEIVLEMI